MFDLDELFEYLERQARYIKSVRYGGRALLVTSLFLLLVALVDMYGLIDLTGIYFILSLAFPPFFALVTALISRQSEVDLDRFLFGIDRRLNSSGKLSALYQIKDEEDKQAIRDLLAQKFFRQVLVWKRKIKVPLSDYTSSILGAAVFGLALVFLLLPPFSTPFDRRRETSVLEEGPAGEVTQSKELVDEKVQEEADLTSTEDPFSYPGSSGLEEETDETAPSGDQELLEIIESNLSSFSELQSALSRMDQQKYLQGDLSDLKDFEGFGSYAREEADLRQAIRINFEDMDQQAREEFARKALQAGEEQAGTQEREEAASRGRAGDESIQDGETGSGSQDTDMAPSPESEDSSASDPRSKPGAEERESMRGSGMGREENPDSFPRLETDYDERFGDQRPGTAKRDPGEEKDNGSAEMDSTFTTKDLEGTLEDIEDYTPYITKGFPFRGEYDDQSGTPSTEVYVESLRSVLKSRDLNPQLREVVRNYFMLYSHGPIPEFFF